MKLNFKSMVLGAILGAALVSGIAFAETIQAELAPHFRVIMNRGQYEEEVTFKDVAGNTVAPIVIDGATYLPLRGLNESVGNFVDWDADANTITIVPQGDMILVRPNAGMYNITDDEYNAERLAYGHIYQRYMNSIGQTYVPQSYKINSISEISKPSGDSLSFRIDFTTERYDISTGNLAYVDNHDYTLVFKVVYTDDIPQFGTYWHIVRFIPNTEEPEPSPRPSDMELTVYFDANGGTGAPEPITGMWLKDNTTIINLPDNLGTPTRAGYRFRGWVIMIHRYMQPDEAPFAINGGLGNAGETMRIDLSGDHFRGFTTLYALWE